MSVIKCILVFAGLSFLIAFFAIKLDYDNTKAFEYIITFLSIATGFNITAFSIIATSPFSGKLYSIEAANDNSKTLLHILVNKFMSSITMFLVTILLILLFYFIEGDIKDSIHNQYSIRDTIITAPKIFKACIWVLTIASSIRFYELLILFSKFVIKSAPKQVNNRSDNSQL